ncbi:hypothetical protein QQG55_20335 [Brugia pahangi]
MIINHYIFANEKTNLPPGISICTTAPPAQESTRKEYFRYSTPCPILDNFRGMLLFAATTQCPYCLCNPNVFCPSESLHLCNLFLVSSAVEVVQLSSQTFGLLLLGFG